MYTYRMYNVKKKLFQVYTIHIFRFNLKVSIKKRIAQLKFV